MTKVRNYVARLAKRSGAGVHNVVKGKGIKRAKLKQRYLKELKHTHD